jgi:hypothetical protein
MPTKEEMEEHARRRAEHDQFGREIELLHKHDEDRFVRLDQFISQQGEARDEQRRHTDKKLDEIHALVQQKIEMDTAILRRQTDVEHRIEGYESRQQKTSELLTKTAVLLDGLVVSTNKDLKNAHDSLREHIEYHTKQLEPRIVALESRGGKWALSVVKYSGFLAALIGLQELLKVFHITVPWLK